jgi:hypothetical protein
MYRPDSSAHRPTQYTSNAARSGIGACHPATAIDEQAGTVADEEMASARAADLFGFLLAVDDRDGDVVRGPANRAGALAF